eukprot:s4382_g12.t1
MAAFNCGSKWHQARDCPLNKESKGKDKQPYPKGNYKGKSKGKGYGGKSKGSWSWRPSYKGKGKKGKGYKGKRYSKRSWYTTPTPGSTSSTSATKFHGFEEKKKVARSLNISEGIPNFNTAVPKTTAAKECAINTSDEEEMIKLGRIERTRSASTDDPNEDEKKTPKDKQHATALKFASSFCGAEEYFVVKGQKRQGLIVDPGAASGLIGSETLRELMKVCVGPYGMKDKVEIEYDKTSPASGISGSADRTLGRITAPLQTNGHSITFTGELLGGEGSLCPPFIGTPALRRVHAILFGEYFEDGDGLLAVDEETDNNHDGQEVTKVKLFRLLLTESGHYLLATDEAQRPKIPSNTDHLLQSSWFSGHTEMPRCLYQNEALLPGFPDSTNRKRPGPRGEDGQPVSQQGTLPRSEDSHEAQDEPQSGILHPKDTKSEIFPPAQLEQNVQHNDNEFNDHQKPCGHACEEGVQQFHSEEDFPDYNEDVLPDDMDHNKLRKL